MKGVAFLAFVAFIFAILPNRVEGKCYACGIEWFGSCEKFKSASFAEKEKNFIKYKKSYLSEVELDEELSETEIKREALETKTAPKIKTNATAAGGEKSSRRRRELFKPTRCQKCKTIIGQKSGKVLNRDCTWPERRLEVNSGVIICEGDLCNGSGAGSLKSSLALVATAFSLVGTPY